MDGKDAAARTQRDGYVPGVVRRQSGDSGANRRLWLETLTPEQRLTLQRIKREVAAWKASKARRLAEARAAHVPAPPRRTWSDAEDVALVRGMARFGRLFEAVQLEYWHVFQAQKWSTIDLKDRFETLVASGALPALLDRVGVAQ